MNSKDCRWCIENVVDEFFFFVFVLFFFLIFFQTNFRPLFGFDGILMGNEMFLLHNSAHIA